MNDHSITLRVEDLSYYVRAPSRKSGEKALLRSVSFHAEPGQMLYILGPSGAGKSTLLDLMAGRITSGRMGGEMYFNGLPSQEAWRRLGQHLVYIRQGDIHLPSLTVRETLTYAARFHLACDEASRQRRVEEVASMLGLTSVLDNRVGGQFQRGISGGQMKRLSVGVEIMQPPSLLLLDEPTSGLDSVMASEVMRFVAGMSKQSHATVLCTIHQPGEEVLALATGGVMLLSRGWVCFHGSVEAARRHFLEHCRDPVALECSGSLANPADFLLEVVSGPTSRAARLHALYLSSPSYQPPPPPPARPPLSSASSSWRSSYHTSLARQMATLLQRGWLVLSRQRSFLRVVVARDIFAGLLYGAVFFQQGRTSKAVPGTLTPTALNLTSALYFTTYSLLWQNTEALGQFFSWRAQYEKERNGHAYSPLAFTLASPFFLLPFTTLGYYLFLAVFCLLSATTAQFSAQHGLGLLCYLLTMASAYLFAYAVAALTRSPETAYVFTPIAFVLLGSLTGFVVTLQNMPAVWRRLSYLAFTRYNYHAAVDLQFSGRADYGAVSAYLSLDDAPLSVAGCLGVLSVFTAAFWAVVYWALLPPRVRLQRVKPGQRPRLSSPGSSREASAEPGLRSLLLPPPSAVKGSGDEEEEAGLRTRLLAVEEGQHSPPGQGGADDDDDEEEEEGKVPPPGLVQRSSSSSPRLVSSSSSPPPALTLADFCERSSSLLPPGPGSGVLSFQDVAYSVDVRRRGRRRTLQVLKGGISGQVAAGEMCALMGPSGAGKTTLLDVLASYKTVGRVTGRIVRSREVRGSAYVPQDDVHLSTLTVHETLTFAALLRIDEEVPVWERRARVSTMERLLGLEEVADVLVGDNFHKGISGGQLRRLTIGVEMMNLPDLLFLDEPTTGLDSSTALEVMSAVRSLSLRGRLVVCTTHQPSPDMFALFDRLTLLADGHMLYHGTLAGFRGYLASPSLGLDASLEPSLPDLVIKVASGVLVTSPSPPPTSEQLAQRFHTSPLGRALDAGLEALWLRHQHQRGEEEEEERRRRQWWWCLGRRRSRRRRRAPRSWVSQVCILNYRQFKTISKDYRSLIINNLNYVVLGLFWATLFSAPHSSQTTLGLLFNGVMISTFTLQLIIPVLYSQRPIFYRERSAGLYGTSAYVLSCDTPYVALVACTSLLFALLVYSWTGLRPGLGPWLFYYASLVMTSLASLNLIECLSALVPSEQELTAVWSLTGYALSILAGYVSRVPTFPGWFGSLTKISFTRWSFAGLAINQFQGQDEAFLEELGFSGASKYTSLLVMAAMIGVFKLVQTGAIRLLAFERR